ncbi:MAG: hypothetical protein WD049_00645 [Candidatus Paceibacterota bacterium]
MSEPEWSLIGCLGTEERSLAVWEELSKTGKLATHKLLRIIDAPSAGRSVSPFTAERNQRLTERQDEFHQKGGDAAVIEKHTLLESHAEIVDSVKSFLAAASPNIVLDVSSLPKRFFFPALKLILLENEVENLVVTYTFPNSYPRVPLALNHNDWAHLPLFSGDYSTSPPQMMIAAVGFEALGLPEQVEHGAGLPIRLLLPFPAQPASFHRSWDLVRKLQSHRSAENIRVSRVDSTSVSDCFDSLLTLSNRGQIPVDLAPFGPKPSSVAMCLFAIATGSPVFYTQPTAYHPDYSLGISTTAGIPNIFAYCLRVEGRDLYSL